MTSISRAWGRFIFDVATRVAGEPSMSPLLRMYRDIERASRESVESFVAERLAKRLSSVVRNVSFYEKYADPLSVAESPTSILASFPLLSKSDLVERAAALQSRSYRGRVWRKTTGGSTGAPVTVVKSADAVAWERASSWSYYQDYGIRIGDRTVRLWGTATSGERSRRARLADLAANRITLSAFAFNEDTLESYWKTCRARQSPFFYGYASMLAAFAEFLERKGYNGRELGVKAVVSTSEVLSEPQRALISRAFCAPVWNEYGCGELGPIAYECEMGQLHVVYSNVIVEVLDEHGRRVGEGQSGRVVVTDLNNQAMGIVRYSVGDNAEVGRPCSCGRHSPTLARIWGREYDFIELTDGRRFHGEFFMYLFEDLASQGTRVRQFQVVQRGSSEVLIRVVAPQDARELMASSILALAADRMPGVSFSIEWVESIPPRASGKTAVIVREQRITN